MTGHGIFLSQKRSLDPRDKLIEVLFRDCHGAANTHRTNEEGRKGPDQAEEDHEKSREN